jgi:hypothetical protein
LNVVGCDADVLTANQNALGFGSVLFIACVVSALTWSPRTVTPLSTPVPLIISALVGTVATLAVHNQYDGYVNDADALEVFVGPRVAVYEVPVTATGLVNVVVRVVYLDVAVLSLCIGVVNVNVPEPVPLLTVPPVAVTAYTLLAEVVIPVPDTVYDTLLYVCKNVLPVNEPKEIL